VVLGEWEAARLAAEHYIDHHKRDERAWAHGSLAELWLLRLHEEGLSEKQRSDFAAEALGHATKLSRLYPGVDEFPVKSTRSQFLRYVYWWGSDRFGKELSERGLQRSSSWSGKGGVVQTAGQLVKILQRGRPSGQRNAGQAPPASASEP